MSVSGRPLLLAVLHEQPAVRIGDVVGRLSRQRRGHVVDALLAAFDFDERADRRFVDRDRDVFVRELLAIFFVAEPHAEAELFEHVQQQQAVADDGLELFAKLHRRVLNRAFEGEQRLAALEAHAQHAAPAAQRVVGRVEQVVFLQPPPSQRRGAGRQNRLAGFVGVAKAELDLPLQNRGHRPAILYQRLVRWSIVNVVWRQLELVLTRPVKPACDDEHAPRYVST